MPPQESLSNNVNENEAGRVSLSCPTEPQNFGSLGSIETPTSIPTISCDSKNPLHKDTDGGYTNAAFLSDFPLKKLPSIDMASLTEPDLKKLPSLAVSNGGERPPVDFDDILPHIGEFGMYQIMLFFCMIPFAFFVAFVYFTQIFITILPDDYWCKVPELEHLPLENRLQLSIPIDAATGAFSRCSQYDVNFTQLLNEDILTPDPSWPIVPCKQGWDFNLSSIPYESIAAEFGWVCENATLPTIAQAIFFVGAICGGLLFGWLADRHGRVPALVACNFVGLIGGLATAGASSFAVFCACRFLVGMAFDNCFTMMYILVLEYVGPKWRTFVANMSIAIFFTMASCLLPWLAYYIADWRILCVVTSAPLALALITPWVVPESARWLVSQGKLDKALGIMKRFEKINNMRVEPQMYQDFIDTCHKAQKENESNKSYSVIDLFRSPRLRRITILLIVIWMAVSLVFDGHVRNVGSLGLDFFVTFTVACATELPADMFLTVVLDRWGRRWLAFGTMVASGMFSLLATTVPIGPASAGLAILGRFSVNISYNIGLQYAAEILPTVVRAQGVALIHIMGYVSSILAPFVVYLANVSTTLPLLILGTLGIFGGILALFLPETLDQDLPQTLQDGENFGKNQTFWTFPCCSPKIDDPEIIEKYRRRSSVLSRRSMRASIRGEVRSSMINRASLRARNSMTNIEKF